MSHFMEILPYVMLCLVSYGAWQVGIKTTNAMAARGKPLAITAGVAAFIGSFVVFAMGIVVVVVIAFGR